MLRKLTLAALLLAASPMPAGADVYNSGNHSGASGSGTATGGSTTVWGIEVTGRDAHRGRGASDVVCSYYRGSGTYGTVGIGELATDLAPGDVVIRICEERGTGRTVSGPTFVTIGEPNAAATLDALVEQAMANLDVDLPVAATSPVNGATLAQIDTWFWVTNTAPQSRSASAAGLTATVRSTLAGVSFDFGSAGTLNCPDGGTPYDAARPARTQSSACTHAFLPPARTIDVDVTSTWRITWSATNGASGSLGTVSRTSTFPLRIRRATTVIRDA